MSLRWQLLLVSLLILVLPWAGCQYVGELESVLRKSEAQQLQARARWLADVLVLQGAALYAAQGIAGELSDPAHDLYAWPMPAAPSLDGYADDWPAEPSAAPWSPGASPPAYLAGTDRHFVYLFVRADGADPGYRLLLSMEDADGRLRRFLVPGGPPGPASPARLEDPAATEWRIQVMRQETAAETLFEVRIPGDMVEGRMGFLLQDAAGQALGGSISDPLMRPGRLLRGHPDLAPLLQRFTAPGQRASVVDAQGWVLGQAGEFLEAAQPDPGPARPSINARLYRLALERDYPSYPASRAPQSRLPAKPLQALQGSEGQTLRYRMADSDQLVLSTAVPLLQAGVPAGWVVLEQLSAPVLTLTDQALSRLVGLSLAAGLAATLGLLGYASYLSLRIRRLRDAARRALQPGGRLSTRLPGAGRGDELGDLTRSFQGLLAELDDYTRYLRHLGDTLAHELRTPMTVVQSSLDNLEHESLPDSARPYLKRAGEGVQRLQGILASLREAARIEQAVRHAEREPVDLAALLRGMTQAYRDAFTDRRFELQAPAGPCLVLGAPDLLAQMLDKLVENAVEFSPAEGMIRLSLQAGAGEWLIAVANQGKPLPPGPPERLFDSLVSVREQRGQAPHLGLGLHIARLVAEHHGGRVRAANSAQLGGAEFSVALPARR